MAKHWRIQKVEGLTVVWETTVPYGRLTEKQIEPMLQRLAARHLTEDEIISGSLRKNAKGHHDLLRVHRDVRPGHVMIYTTLDPHYLVTVVDDT